MKKLEIFFSEVGFSDYQLISHPENPECKEELILKLETAP